MKHTPTFVRGALAAAVFAMTLPSFAATGDTLQSGAINITIEQEAALNSFAKWTLLGPTGDGIIDTGAIRVLENQPAGLYTIFIEQPKGMGTTVDLYEGTKKVQTRNTPQMTFTATGGLSLKVHIKFKLENSGQVNVTSNPKGVPFELRGPNAQLYKGVTPQVFDPVPIGLYSVRFLPEGCPDIPAKSGSLDKDSRLDMSVVLKCDTLKVVSSSSSSSKASTVMEDDVSTRVTFSDVASTAWFAGYASNVAKLKIIEGYRDENGNPLGTFGPQNEVNLAELAKIAHAVAGMTLDVTGVPQNESALDMWASAYIASAERGGWKVYQDLETDVARSATRAEVVSTLLQALDVPVRWPKGRTFTDVSVTTNYAAEVETAYADGIVSGVVNASGITTGEFGPDRPINRAELAKILSQALAKYRAPLN